MSVDVLLAPFPRSALSFPILAPGFAGGFFSSTHAKRGAPVREGVAPPVARYVSRAISRQLKLISH